MVEHETNESDVKGFFPPLVSFSFLSFFNSKQQSEFCQVTEAIKDVSEIFLPGSPHFIL